MCKKLVLAAAAILIGTAVVKHTSIGSLVQVWWHDAKQAVERQVPLEVQIRQLAVEVGKIDADIKKNLSRLAHQEVETQKLEEDVVALKDNQAALKAEITAMTKGLESNAELVSLGTKNVRAGTLARQLDGAVARYERTKAEVKTKEKLLGSKKEALEAAHARIGEMHSQKEQLRTTIADLETRLQLARLEATRKNAGIEFDDSQVARCKQLANQIRDRLSEQEAEQRLDVQYGYGNPIPKFDETKPTVDVLKAAKKALQDDDDRVAAGEGK
jgi:chromosome segregation ATPase